MLSQDQIEKVIDNAENIFREENEGRHIVLKTIHSVYNSGTLQFEFDIHVQEFRLTTDREDNLSLLIVIACRNPKLVDIQWEREHEIPEEPILEYYENLTNEEAGKFSFSNTDEIRIDKEMCDYDPNWIDLDQRRVNRIFDYFEDQLNENSVYNVNLSKVVFNDEIMAKTKAIEEALARDEKIKIKLEKKEKRDQAVEKAKDTAKSTVAGVGIIAAATMTAPIIVPLLPVILLSSCLGCCVAGFLDTFNK